MTLKKKTKPNKELLSKAQQVLEFAEEKARHVAYRTELSNALFGVAGKATLLFPTVTERTAFSKTVEFKQILELMSTLPSPPVEDMGDLPIAGNGTINLHLPRSVHDALLSEAKAEGVSLNELCVAKLVTQLRAVICPANGRAG